MNIRTIYASYAGVSTQSFQLSVATAVLLGVTADVNIASSGTASVRAVLSRSSETLIQCQTPINGEQPSTIITAVSVNIASAGNVGKVVPVYFPGGILVGPGFIYLIMTVDSASAVGTCYFSLLFR